MGFAEAEGGGRTLAGSDGCGPWGHTGLSPHPQTSACFYKDLSGESWKEAEQVGSPGGTYVDPVPTEPRTRDSATCSSPPLAPPNTPGSQGPQPAGRRPRRPTAPPPAAALPNGDSTSRCLISALPAPPISRVAPSASRPSGSRRPISGLHHMRRAHVPAPSPRRHVRSAHAATYCPPAGTACARRAPQRGA